jgi:heat-inducible transcriptional repressor
MEELTARQKVILTLVTHEHIKTAAPIGSRSLVDRFNLKMSSATIRNEMAALTEKGYLRQPHTSAGRVPTESGYRFFVGRLVNETEIPEPTKRKITHQFFQMRNEVEQWMRLAASVLADQSKAASMITAPHLTKAQLKHVEFISTSGKQVLMVLVLVGGEIRQRLQSLSEPVSQQVLSNVANHLSNLFYGFTVEKIASNRSRLSSELERSLLSWVSEEMGQVDTFGSGELFLDGITNVLAEPEFNDTGEARKALRVLEERTLLNELFSNTVLNIDEGSVQVLIGGENEWDDLSQCSIVLSKYGAPGLAYGTVGVLGPIRMAYGQTISAVRFMSGLLSDMVSQSLFEDQIVSSQEVES